MEEEGHTQESQAEADQDQADPLQDLMEEIEIDHMEGTDLVKDKITIIIILIILILKETEEITEIIEITETDVQDLEIETTIVRDVLYLEIVVEPPVALLEEALEMDQEVFFSLNEEWY